MAGRSDDVNEMNTGTDEQPVQPSLAIVANVCTPYRSHFHRRIAAEIPELRLISVFTHGQDQFVWDHGDLDAINPVWVGRPDSDASEAGKPGRWREELAMGRKIIELIGREDVRCVILNGYNDLSRIRLLTWCPRHQVPLFLWADSNIKGDRPRTALHAFIKRLVVGWIVRRCTGCLPVGRYGESYFQKYGADPRRCFRVPLEPDYGLFQNVHPEDLAAFRTRHGLPADRRYLLFSGRLIGLKRIDLLLDAFAAIAEERPGWDLLIAGDGELRDALQQRIPSHLAARVHWLGFLDMADLRFAYRISHALALPSDYDAWALVINEALAAGLPVVASDVVGAAAELVEDGVNGRIFRAGDLAGLTDALRDITDDATCEAMAAQAPVVLERWRRTSDPVQGLRRALGFAGVLPATDAAQPPADA